MASRIVGPTGRGRGRGGAAGVGVGLDSASLGGLSAPVAAASAAIDADDSDADDNDATQDADDLVSRVLQAYADADGRLKASSALHEFLQTGNNVCLICLDTIKHAQPIWSCAQCHDMFHIGCIQSWVREGVQRHTYLTDDLFPNRVREWFCPKCRRNYAQDACPTRYRCFCGKVEDPPHNPWATPHSCGETCGRALEPACGHRCVLLCHPGSCPPCPQTLANVPCFCGAQKMTRRCGNKLHSCGGVCGRVLACGVHTCAAPCHAGPCAACPQTSMQRCACGAEARERLCATPTWHCTRLCNKQLACGHHTCQQTCHVAGECGACPRSLSRACPCGKQTSDRPCTEEIPCCGDTCGKTIVCRVHPCPRKCHAGPCDECRYVATKTCRCGSVQKELPCRLPLVCERRCTVTRSCGNHPCRRKCCAGDCPPCEEVCGRRLGCGTHKCSAPCHSGTCYPCPLTVTIACECGRTTITVPCGRERHTAPPRCKEACRLPPYCRHPTQTPHKCHTGDCLTCKQTCGQPMPCGHTCPALCHDERPPTQVAVITKTARKKGLVPTAMAAAPQPTPCPPCMQLVPRPCIGAHPPVLRPCHVPNPVSCGLVCQHTLPCGRHDCTRMCHRPDVPTAAAWLALPENSQPCGACELPCKLPRACDHECPQLCHPGACTPCAELVQRPCHCGRLPLSFVCAEFQALTAGERHARLVCALTCVAELACGHPCARPCHAGAHASPADCRVVVTLRCKCGHVKRDERCAEVEKIRPSIVCTAECTAAAEALKAAKAAAKAAAVPPAKSASQAAATVGRAVELKESGGEGQSAPAVRAATSRAAPGPLSSAAPAKKTAKTASPWTLTPLTWALLFLVGAVFAFVYRIVTKIK